MRNGDAMWATPPRLPSGGRALGEDNQFGEHRLTVIGLIPRLPFAKSLGAFRSRGHRQKPLLDHSGTLYPGADFVAVAQQHDRRRCGPSVRRAMSVHKWLADPAIDEAEGNRHRGRQSGNVRHHIYRVRTPVLGDNQDTKAITDAPKPFDKV